MHKKIKEDSACAEAMHKTLMDNLKEELCRVTHNSKDECYLEVEDTMKNIELEFYVDVREDGFEGREKIAETKEIVEVVNA